MHDEAMEPILIAAVVLAVLILAGGLWLFVGRRRAGQVPEEVSANREPFHRLSCKWAQKISPKNAVYYNTKEEAIRDGHRPCKVCKP